MHSRINKVYLVKAVGKKKGANELTSEFYKKSLKKILVGSTFRSDCGVLRMYSM